MEKLNFIFLCSENSCRSIMFEAIFNHYSIDNLQAYSAGAEPKRNINLRALRTLELNNINTKNLYSKSISDLELQKDFHADIIITVCSKANNASCPILLKKLPQIHFDIYDPSKLTLSETELEEKFKQLFLLFKSLTLKINNIPINKLSNLQIAQKIQQLY